MAETILIDFQVDATQLDKAIDVLEKTGVVDSKLANDFKQTTAEINKQSQALKQEATAAAAAKDSTQKLVLSATDYNKALKQSGLTSAGFFAKLKDGKKSIEDVNKATKDVSRTISQSFQEGVVEGFQDALQEAGVTMDQFEQKVNELKNGEGALEEKTVSLRTRMRLLREEMTELVVKGEQSSDKFRELQAEAGRLQDAMDDVNNEVKNAASDTRNIDNLLGTAQAISGGFAVAQGAAALFGDESEELQKTLLKVNAAMAITQGLQQVSLGLEKEGAITRLTNTIATKAQTAAQVIYNTVVGSSIGLMKAFRIALAATGVGLLVLGIIALVEALKSEEDSLKKVNDALERNKALIEADIDAIERRTEISIAQAQVAGAAESELTRLRGRSLQQQQQAIIQVNRELELQRSQLDTTTEAYDKLNTAIEDNNNAIKDIDHKILLESLNLQKQLADEAKQAADDAKKAAEDAAKERRELRDQELQDQLAALERQLLQAEAGSQQELDLQKKIVQAKANLELNQEKLSRNEILLIRERSLNDQLLLERAFNERITAEAIAAQISRNNAELVNIQANADDRLLLTISNIELQSAAEIIAAEGNAAKIKEIYAKRDAEIATARKAFIEDAVNFEISLEQARQGAVNRGLQRIVDDEKRTADLRITAVQQLAEFEVDQIDKRLDALEQERQQRLISEQEYNLRYEQLQDQRTQIYENTEKKITDINKAETEKRKQRERETIELVLNTTQQVIGILGQLDDTRKQQDDDRISAERARVDELLEAGAITEKEAIARNKRIDQEEKKLKREQAVRDKNLAIFNAVINTAAAITKALPNLVLAGIAGALGLAQVAVIAARPIPRFRTGKKNQYQGPGKIGEAGAEILESNGRLFVANKETTVWLGKNDKVYTPEETKKMLPSVDRKLMQPAQEKKQNAKEVATELAKEIRKIPQTGINVDENGFKTWVQEGNSRKIYHDKYYSS